MILLQLETAIAATVVHMFSQDAIICVDLFVYSLYFSPQCISQLQVLIEPCFPNELATSTSSNQRNGSLPKVLVAWVWLDLRVSSPPKWPNWMMESWKLRHHW